VEVEAEEMSTAADPEAVLEAFMETHEGMLAADENGGLTTEAAV
jgi:hypothetical protein